jgi:hypothetical protein
MSTGQSTSRVGDSASNPAENSSNTVQAVASQDEVHISSFVNRANNEVDDAIAYLIKDYQGTDIPDSVLRQLSGQIKNIISLTFLGEAAIEPTTSLPASAPDFGRLYDAVKHSGNTPVTISSDCVFFEMLTVPENLASFIENISGWFSMWSNATEKWAGNEKTSAGDYSVLMEFLGRMIVAAADHDAQENESDRLKAENAALTTESKWLAKTLDKTRENLEVLKAGTEKITELQAEVDLLRSRYESSTDAQKGGSAK